LLASGRILEVTVERSSLQGRDVNRLIRLSELFDRFPGPDSVILYLVSTTGDTTVLTLGEGVQCCVDLVQQVGQEVGDACVQIRARGPAAASTTFDSGSIATWPGTPATERRLAS
jgi:hypothetical protein